MRIGQLETPALIIDLDLFEENILTMKRLLEKNKLSLRPHYKSHKCPHIAHIQMKEGAIGITCAKLSEAEDLILSGIDNVLIANQVIEPSKITRVAYLAHCCYLTVCVDQQENILALETAAAAQGSTIHCLIEYEIGMNRCGVKTPEDFLKLVKCIEACPHLTFEGIQAYAGNLSHIPDAEIRRRESEKVEQLLGGLKKFIETSGYIVKEVSGTSTGTVEYRDTSSVYTEIQAGSYLFMDTAYYALKTNFKNSLFLLVQAISVNKDSIIFDAGAKSLSLDQNSPVFNNYPTASVGFSEEHCSIPNIDTKIQLGDKLLMIPGHCCTTINLHDYIYFVRNEKVIDRVTVRSRGKSI